MTEAGRHAKVATKLQAARTRLVLDQPFIGALLLHLSLESWDECDSVATDGRSLYFNPRFIERLEMRHTQFVLAHEALHCALGHFARRGHRSRRRWDIACDYAVNLMLVDEGFAPPPGILLDTRFRGLSAEEIYPLIPEASEQVTLDRHLFDVSVTFLAAVGGANRFGRERSQAGGAGASPTVHGDDGGWSDAAAQPRRKPGACAQRPLDSLDELTRRWQVRLAMAAQQASRAGRLGASWQRVLGRTLESPLPWSALLALHIVNCAREDYTFQRHARREGDAVLPRLHSGQLDVVVVLDTSGSVSDVQLSAFTSEIDALKGQVRARVTLHACDEQLAAEGPWVFEPWEPIDFPSGFRGGSGTDFRPVFAWIENEGMRPDLLIYFTDAEGRFPQSAPPYPVIWLVKGPAPVPWGERIQLN